MSTTPPEIMGRLESVGGVGVVRIDTSLRAAIEDVWAACTDRDRLVHWYGPIEGDLSTGGSIRIHVTADGWYGTGRIEACEPPGRLRLTTRESDESWQEGEGVAPFDEVIEVTLEPVGAGTAASVVVTGIPLDGLEYYGVGWQLHAERLAAYLGGAEAPDADTRWSILLPPYQAMAAALT